MNGLNQTIEQELIKLGADMVGFGNLEELPKEARVGLPIGICVVVVYPKEIIKGIWELPTREYREWYNKLNVRLDAAVSQGAAFIQNMGYKSVALTREYV